MGMSNTSRPTVIEEAVLTPNSPRIEISIRGWLTLEAYQSFIQYTAEAEAQLVRRNDCDGFLSILA